MYDNIGKKIKLLTKIVTIALICLCVIAFFVFTFTTDDIRSCESGFLGIFCLFVLPLFIWAGSFYAYGFGELIDKVCDLGNKSSDCSNAKADVADDKEKEQKLRSLLERGLISEEEYRDIISK